MNGFLLGKKNFAAGDRKFALIQVEFLSDVSSDLVLLFSNFIVLLSNKN